MTDQLVRPSPVDAATRVQIGDANVVWHYGDFTSEYDAIRQGSALFDHTGQTLLRIDGNFRDFLQTVLARDVEYMSPENCMTSLLLREDGSPVDAVTVYMFDEHALVKSSVGCGTAVLAHLTEQLTPDASITRLDDLRVLGLEGPYAWAAVGEVVHRGVTALPYESIATLDWQGEEFLFTRTGFTGEYGYEIIASSAAITEYYNLLAEHATPAGYQALETAMLEVRQPIVRVECDASRNVITAGMNWLIDPTKDSFIGKDAILDQFETRSAATVGLILQERVAKGDAVLIGDENVGSVAVVIESPGLGAYLALATVQRELGAAGIEFRVVGGSSTVSARSVPAPYVVPASWLTPML